jgi:hypothetical protein
MMPSRKRSVDSKFLFAALIALTLAQCGDKARCEQLRDETYAKRHAWAECVSDDDCFTMPGNPRDCTGVLSCPFAVNIRHREEADRLSLTIGEDSVDCHVCAVPNCATSSRANCEMTSHQCVTADKIDGGEPTFGPPANLPDAQLPPLPPIETPDATGEGGD